jgi:hypothetical protein
MFLSEAAPVLVGAELIDSSGHNARGCPVVSCGARKRAPPQHGKTVTDMKIAVIGGTGLIGSQVVKILNASGHEAVPHSPSTGVDLLTGQGLPEALRGANVVVNLTNSPTFDDASPAFFQTSMDNLLGAAKSAGVGHAVILSIVGAELVPGLVYYRAKVLQENILKSGPVPYSIVRVTQFFEFMAAAMSWVADEHTVHLPATLIQPIAAGGLRPPRQPGRSAAWHAQRRGPRGLHLRRTGPDHPRRPRRQAHRGDRQQRRHVRRGRGGRPAPQGGRHHRQDHLPGVAGALESSGTGLRAT